jgi:acetyl/propionyl-CoA carboxylase alpha subunit/acetyl-CoA carboxylase carboxyltransferase component
MLVANRGEIALRVFRAAGALGIATVGVCPADDEAALHTRRCDEAVRLPGGGVAAYLDVAAIVDAARQVGADCVHPGYGFLSESPALARAVTEAGLRFIGPTAEALEVFGDKGAARGLAQEHGVPTVAGTSSVTTLSEMEKFFEALGAGEHAVVIKALAGGGGRGMRVVRGGEELAEAFAACEAEARHAFGRGDLYIERLVEGARHIEVQVLGDGTGDVVHLWDRDCSVQRRHQKIIEIAPASGLDPAARRGMLAAAARLTATLDYRGLATVEFLATPEGEFFFLEVNPRVQVEHTVTEEITGVDLVRAQIEVAAGARLGELGLTQAQIPRPHGCAIQVRINAETMTGDGTPVAQAGRLERFELPSGYGIRTESAGYPGYPLSPRFDSLLAKIVVHDRTGFAGARRLALRALAETGVDGVATNLAFGHAILSAEEFGRCDTRYVDAHLDQLLAAAEAYRAHTRPDTRPTVEPAARSTGRPLKAPAGTVALTAPMSGQVTAVEVAPGELVARGQRVATLEAMKMQHVLRAERAGEISALLVGEGDLLSAGDPVAFVAPREHDAAGYDAAELDEGDLDDWSDEVEEIRRRRELAYRMGGEEKIARQHAAGRMTVRDRITALVDPGSFDEVGVLAGFAEHGAHGQLTQFTPANFVVGTARLAGRRIVVGGDDFTIRGGAGDASIPQKQIYGEQLANELRMPLVRLIEGTGGGGSVRKLENAGHTYVPVNPGWDLVVDNLSTVPVVSACLGPVAGLGAGRAVMSHLCLLVEGNAQLFVAGPPLVRYATGEDLSKDELGGADVHRRSGAVERIVASEAEAFEVTRRFLSYLPASVDELPPVTEPRDDPERAEPLLLSAVPHDRRRPYRLRPILEAVFDRDSVFDYAGYGGSTYTGLARLDGHPVGVLATDPDGGATMTPLGADAIIRLADLCETFHLPLVSLTDQAGMVIGLAGEQAGAIRRGARAGTAIYQARVPTAEVIVRRVFGVGGAAMTNRHRLVRRWAWPSGDWGSLPVEGGIEAAYRAEIEASDDPAAHVAAIKERLEGIRSPLRTAEHFGVEDVIDPRETRRRLVDWVRDAYRVLPPLLGRPSFGTRP